jgi:hypothetical protein
VLKVHDLLQTVCTSSSDATASTDELREQVAAAIKELTSVGEKCILLEAPGLVSHCVLITSIPVSTVLPSSLEVLLFMKVFYGSDSVTQMKADTICVRL